MMAFWVKSDLQILNLMLLASHSTLIDHCSSLITHRSLKLQDISAIPVM